MQVSEGIDFSNDNARAVVSFSLSSCFILFIIFSCTLFIVVVLCFWVGMQLCWFHCKRCNLQWDSYKLVHMMSLIHLQKNTINLYVLLFNKILTLLFYVQKYKSIDVFCNSNQKYPFN